MHLSNFPSELFGLIIEYGNTLDHIKLFTTNKKINVLFFNSYISQILDINNIISLLNTSQQNNKFFIEMKIKLLFKKINKRFIKKTYVMPTLHMFLDKYNVSIASVIINPNIINLIIKLITRGDTLYDISNYVPKLGDLYILYNITFIDNLIYRGDSLYNISSNILQLLDLYTLDNKSLIDNLIYRGDHLYNISTYFSQLLQLYTLDNKPLIDNLIYSGKHIKTIINIYINS